MTTELLTEGATALMQPVLLAVAWSFALLLVTAGSRAIALQKGVMPLRFYKAHLGSEVPEHLQKIDRAFENLFEIGVLFYPAVAFAILFGVTGETVLMAAWISVLARIAQSICHITFNNVHLRFVLFLVSCIGHVVIWWQVGAAVL